MLSSIGWLEVMDKEWPLLLVLIVHFGGGVLGYFGCRKKPWTGWITIPFLFLLGFGHLLELTDPYVGPAILREAGVVYVAFGYVSIVVGVVLPIAGLISKKTG